MALAERPATRRAARPGPRPVSRTATARPLTRWTEPIADRERTPSTAPRLAVVPRRRRAMRWFVAALVVASGTMVVAAWFQTRLAERQAVLDRLDRQVRREIDRYHELRRVRAAHLAPEVLIERAIELGMKPVRRAAVFTLDRELIDLVELAAPLGSAGDTGSTRSQLIATISAIKSAAEGRR